MNKTPQISNPELAGGVLKGQRLLLSPLIQLNWKNGSHMLGPMCARMLPSEKFITVCFNLIIGATELLYN